MAVCTSAVARQLRCVRDCVPRVPGCGGEEGEGSCRKRRRAYVPVPDIQNRKCAVAVAGVFLLTSCVMDWWTTSFPQTPPLSFSAYVPSKFARLRESPVTADVRDRLEKLLIMYVRIMLTNVPEDDRARPALGAVQTSTGTW
jgi:hypothetical protein